ncbi:MAG: hypothetical protein ACE5IW_00695 [bacterium]
MEKKKVVLIRPRLKTTKNDATKFTYIWASKVLKKFLDADVYIVFDLKHKEAMRKKVEGVLHKIVSQVGVVVFYGHGGDSGTSLFGSDGKALIDLQNNQLLKNKICYMIACFSAHILGKDSISAEKKAFSYIGFQDRFVFIPFLEKSFGRCANAGIIKMITDGCTTGDAERTIRKNLIFCEKWWQKRKKFVIASLFRFNYIANGRKNLTIHGYKNINIK